MYNINEKIVLGLLLAILFVARLLLSIEITPGAGILAQKRDFFLIDLNKATPDELRLMPYVSKAMAQEIISYRQEKGLFKSTDELSEIKGIGPARLKRMKKYIKDIN